MKPYIFILTALLILFFSASNVRADMPAPQRDYVVYTGNGEYVFVMLAATSPDMGWVEQDKEIRRKYPHSGLYSIDNSRKALWTVDWYSHSVHLSYDGRHLIQWGPWAYMPDYSDLALAFYEDGEPLRAYRVNQLVAVLETLPRTSSHYGWLAEEHFAPFTKQLFLRTYNGEELLFDAATGSVIEGTLHTWKPMPTPTPTPSPLPISAPQGSAYSLFATLAAPRAHSYSPLATPPARQGANSPPLAPPPAHHGSNYSPLTSPLEPRQAPVHKTEGMKMNRWPFALVFMAVPLLIAFRISRRSR